MQPIELGELVSMKPCAFNILKYIFRHKDKNGKEDLEKALNYCDIFEKYKDISTMYDHKDGEFCYYMFSRFIATNKQLSESQVACVIGIMNSNLKMIRFAINKEMQMYSETSDSETIWHNLIENDKKNSKKNG